MNINSIHNVFFVGIGGIGMSAIARYFVALGKNVAGYDRTPSQITTDLEALGVEIHFDDDSKNIPISFLNKEKTLVIFTPAIPNNQSELVYFEENNFNVLKRAKVLGMISKNTFCLAVAGTHGKTTTSAILGHIMTKVNATSFLGGISENYDSNLLLGEDKICVVEADEFDRSFLQLHPNIACITSMDADHLDIYKEVTALQESFVAFSQQVSETLIFAKGLPLNGLTYAVNERADYMAFNLKIDSGKYIFDVKTPISEIENIEFHLPGKHNVMNALAALAMADVFGISLDEIKDSLRTFKGVKRRFTYKIKTPDFVLIDDYAHHPTEIVATLESVKVYKKQKGLDYTTVIWQPHKYSRTIDNLEYFKTCFKGCDKLIILPVWSVAEEIKNIDFAKEFQAYNTILADKISVTSGKIELIKDDEAFHTIDNGMVVGVGAGDITYQLRGK